MNNDLCTTRYGLFSVYTLVVAQEKKTKRTVASEKRIDFYFETSMGYKPSTLGNFLGTKRDVRSCSCATDP